VYEDPSPIVPAVEVRDLVCVSGDFALYKGSCESQPVELWVAHGSRARGTFVERSSAWLNLAPAGLMGADQVGQLDDGTPYRMDRAADGLCVDELEAPLSEDAILQIAHSLARRLGLAHEQDLIHGAVTIDKLRLAKTPDGWNAALSAPAPLPLGGSPAQDLRDLSVLLVQLRSPEAPPEPASASLFQDPGLKNLIRSCLAEDEALRPANAWAFRQLLDPPRSPPLWPVAVAVAVALVAGALLAL
jgi:hypothetical protein